MYFQKAIVEKEISYLLILCLLIYYNIAIEEDWSKYNSFHVNSFFPLPPTNKTGYTNPLNPIGDWKLFQI